MPRAAAEPATGTGRSARDELRHGAWLVFHPAALTPLSWLGTFGGSGRLPAPYDSVAVGALALGVFVWAVRSGADRIRTAPAGASSGPAV